MRIGICGPSGTGKTTLAKEIAKILNCEYKPLSATMILEEMGLQMGTKGMGHRGLINKSSAEPDWGIHFQERLLESRRLALKGRNNVVIDRTPVDNLTYAMYECLHNVDEAWVEKFREACYSFYITFDLIIFLPYTHNQPHIEDNGSRIPNIYFQELISGIFEQQLKVLFNMDIEHKRGGFIAIDHWDFEKRMKIVKRVLSEIDPV